ncbi:hypothetical protein Ciccas_011877, partial [Cichlidogyrus casuarinus]
VRLIRAARCPSMLTSPSLRHGDDAQARSLPPTVEDYPALPDMHVSTASIVGRPGWAEHEESMPADEEELGLGCYHRISFRDVPTSRGRDSSPPGLNDRLLDRHPSLKLGRIQISSLKQPPRLVAASNRNRTISETKVREDMLANSVEASQWVPKLAVKRSTMLRRDMTKLRRWFVDDYICKSKTSDSDQQLTMKLSLQAQDLWDIDDLLVGDWLAQQLEYQSLHYVPMSNARVAQLPLEKNVKITESGTVIKNVDALRKEAVLNQIRRLLEANPDLVTDVLGSLSSSLPEEQLCTMAREFLAAHELKNTQEAESSTFPADSGQS